MDNPLIPIIRGIVEHLAPTLTTELPDSPGQSVASKNVNLLNHTARRTLSSEAAAVAALAIAVPAWSSECLDIAYSLLSGYVNGDNEEDDEYYDDDDDDSDDPISALLAPVVPTNADDAAWQRQCDRIRWLDLVIEPLGRGNAESMAQLMPLLVTKLPNLQWITLGFGTSADDSQEFQQKLFLVLSGVAQAVLPRAPKVSVGAGFTTIDWSWWPMHKMLGAAMVPLTALNLNWYTMPDETAQELVAMVATLGCHPTLKDLALDIEDGDQVSAGLLAAILTATTAPQVQFRLAGRRYGSAPLPADVFPQLPPGTKAETSNVRHLTLNGYIKCPFARHAPLIKMPRLRWLEWHAKWHEVPVPALDVPVLEYLTVRNATVPAECLESVASQLLMLTFDYCDVTGTSMAIKFPKLHTVRLWSLPDADAVVAWLLSSLQRSPVLKQIMIVAREDKDMSKVRARVASALPRVQLVLMERAVPTDPPQRYQVM
ncbi:hypothetical protein BC828DRAFT_393162 [Blastocladiella britannica]|nr:hypothetical protein BC828DRAFT_393162 [Blastocladiella britannica]